jgi:hypothetical protein
MPQERKTFPSNGHAGRTAAAGGELSPIEVLLAVMHRYWEAGQLDKAVAVAKDAAPYVHPRLSAAEVTAKGGTQVNLLAR